MEVYNHPFNHSSGRHLENSGMLISNCGMISKVCSSYEGRLQINVLSILREFGDEISKAEMPIQLHVSDLTTYLPNAYEKNTCLMQIVSKGVFTSARHVPLPVLHRGF